MKKLLIIFTIIFTASLFPQAEGDVIITEIANGVNKKALYNGGDYVELLVMKEEGVKMAGWFLTDLSSTSGQVKETQGWVKFSDGEKSIFNQVIPKGTYILICLGEKDQVFGKSKQNEDVSLRDGNNRIVVFGWENSDHVVIPDSGKIGLTQKDNVALVSAWNKKSGIDCVSWGREISWQGCEVTNIDMEKFINGSILYMKEESTNNTDASLWVITTDKNKATPGAKNPVD